MKFLALLLILSIVLFCVGAGQPAGSDASCSEILNALRVVKALKPGDSRAAVERNFERDGGFQAYGQSRYVFKNCKYIKVDFGFSTANGAPSKESLPSDKILTISRPYLEYPAAD